MYIKFFLLLLLSVAFLGGCQDCSRSSIANAKTQEMSLVGVWQSTDDSSYTREFTADGRVIDLYEGNASNDETGTYQTVDTSKEVIKDIPSELTKGVHVIKLTFSGTEMYFSVVTLTDTSLELGVYGRGNTLSFKRIK